MKHRLQANFSIDKDLKKAFIKHCQENYISASRTVEDLIKDWLIPRLTKDYRSKE